MVKNCVQLKCVCWQFLFSYERTNFWFRTLSFFFRCRKIFSDEKGKLEEAELSNALTEITAEHNSVIQTNTTESKAWWAGKNPGGIQNIFFGSIKRETLQEFWFPVPLTTYLKQHTFRLIRVHFDCASFLVSVMRCLLLHPRSLSLGHKRFILFFYCYFI